MILFCYESATLNQWSALLNAMNAYEQRLSESVRPLYVFETKGLVKVKEFLERD